MRRQPRLNAPGTLHPVMGRGIEGTKIFRKDTDREDFLSRMGNLCQEDFLAAYLGELPELQKYPKVHSEGTPPSLMEHCGTKAARHLEVTTSAVNWLTLSEGLPDLGKYLKLF